MVKVLLQAFYTQIQLQRDRWVYWLPLPVALGIIWYFSLSTEPPLFMGTAALCGVLILCGAFYRNRAWLPLWLVIILLLTGFTAAQWRTWAVEAPALQKKTYPISLEGQITDIDPLPKAYRIVLNNITVADGDMWEEKLPKSVRVKLKSNDPAEPAAGDIVRVKAVLMPIASPVLPGAFDFQRYAFFRGLGATGYAIGDMEVVHEHTGGFVFEKMRRYIREKIEDDVENKDHAALITAFMIGESNGISQEVWDISRLSGIAHLIAISGSHFVMIAGFPFFLIRALLAAIPFVALRWPVKKIAAVVAIAASVFYMLLIGSPIPAQRAVVSVSVVMLAIILDRDPFTLRLAVFSALVILLLKPESLLGASFELSFAAIIALVAFYEGTREWWQRHFREENLIRRYSFYLIGCFMTTLVASSATASFAMFHFSSMPLIAGLAANMIAVPLTTFVTFPMGLLACLLMPAGLEKIPLWLTEKSLDIVMAVAEDVTHWPYANMHVNAWPMWILGMMSLGGLWLCFWREPIRWLGVMPIIAGMVFIPLTPRPDILLSENAHLFAVRAEDGNLLISSARHEKFIGGEWNEQEGGADPLYWPVERTEFTCPAEDECVYTRKGHLVTFVEDTVMLTDDTFINYRDLRKSGAQEIYLGENESYRIRTVKDVRGVRPWTMYPGLRSSVPEFQPRSQTSPGETD